jgi:L-threonylcarbamoyladenylate synthase
MSTNILYPHSTIIAQATNLLQSSQLVAVPTETVYGLAADATDDKAVAQIFACKGRPSFNPLIIHVSDVDMAGQHVQWNAEAESLASTFWPGPLTLVLFRSAASSVSLLASAGGDTLAVRCPAHPVMHAVIAACGRPLAAPSANRSGRVSPTSAQHVREEFGDTIPLIIDGGECKVGVESTVLDLTGAAPVLLRPGSVLKEDIERVLQREVLLPSAAETHFKSPGMLESHYAPHLPVRLHATQVAGNEALIAFGTSPLQGAAHTINISERADLTEAAAHVFAALRTLDQPGLAAIAVMPIPEEGLGIAINDRLRRAAAPRP